MEHNYLEDVVDQRKREYVAIFHRKNAWEQSSMNNTFKPSANPGPRNDLEDVLLALSKLDLKTNGSPSLEVHKWNLNHI